jgi:capsular exopolysaccharide synthesis family protein
MWRERWLILSCVVACLAMGVVFLTLATPIYTSTAKMSVTYTDSPITRTGQQSATDQSGSYLYTERELISSPAVLSLAAQMPEIKSALRLQSQPIRFLQQNLSVDIGKHDTIISVSFSSSDKQFAANVANAVVKAYINYQTKPKPQALAELERIAEEQSKLEDQIKVKEATQAELVKQYGPLNNTQNGTEAEHQLGGLLTELHAAHLETLKDKSELEEAQTAARAIRDAEPDAGDLPLGQDQKNQLTNSLLALQAQMQDLLRRYGEQHPQVLAVRHRMNQLRVLYARAVERQFRVTLQRENDLKDEYEDLKKQSTAASAAMAEYQRLQVDIDNAKRKAETIDDRKRQIEIARDIGTLDIDNYEHAEPEPKASRPSKTFVLAVALLCGLVLGSGGGFLHDWFDDRFRTVEEMRSATGLHLLGVVPGNTDTITPGLLGQQALLEPMSAMAEACRMVRTAINYGAAKDRRRTLLITSPSQGEGKSTLASNLAIVMAQSGKRVLLVDADLRLPTQHKTFGVANDGGLSSVLQSRITLEQAVERTELDGLELLPAGPQSHNPAEILNSPMFTEMLDILFDRYDQVIIDSAPVVGLADTRIIAASCDATVMVLRERASTRRMTQLARQGLTSVGAQILGIVINDATDHAGVSPHYTQARIRDLRDRASVSDRASNGHG